jgi:hypothetical protein
VTFEYLTPEEAVNFTPEQAEWEEAALKREAAQDQALSERLQRLAAHQWARVRRIEGALPEKPRPQFVLIRGEKDDDA